MGGLVAVGLIANGELKTVVGHTNTLPETIKNRSFVDGDVSQFEARFDRYGNRNLPDSMDDEAFGFSDHVPSEYGYVLVDLSEKTILSAQDYTSFTSLNGPRIATDGAAQIVAGRITFDENDEVVVVPAGPYATVEEFLADPENDPRRGIPTFGEILDEVRALVPHYQPTSENGFGELVVAAADTLPEADREAFLAKVLKTVEEDDALPLYYSYRADFGSWEVYDGTRAASDFGIIRDYLADRGHLTEEMTSVWDREILRLTPDADCDEDLADAPRI